MAETAEEAGRKLRVKARKHYSEDCLQDVDIEGQRMFSVEEKLLSDQFTPDFVREMRGEDFNLEYVQREGFNYPLLFKEKKGLGIRVPSENFSVNDVCQCVGSRRVVDVMDVTTQKDQEMTMKEWCHYFDDPHRDKLLNVISLEFSHTKLENYVESPDMVVRQIDWVDCVWPRHLKESQTVGTNTILNMKYPKVRKYCLMSVKGCYTDFHIDFGGTSVWYHIIKGKKRLFCIGEVVFDQKVNPRNDRWICKDPSEIPVVMHTKFPASVMVLGVISSEGDVMPPHFFEKGLRMNADTYINVLETVVNPWMDMVAAGRNTRGTGHDNHEDNIQHYEKWVLSGKQGDVFFGDTVPKCARVNLEQGYTFFIPSDSLVFGGNFLHSFGIEQQLRISEVEDLTKVPFKFRYPFYQELLWYVLQRYLHCVANKNHLVCNEEGEPLEDPTGRGGRESRKVQLTKYELSGLAAVIQYLEVKVPPNRRLVPSLIRDPQLLLEDAKDLLKEHCHDDHQSAITGKPVLFWEGIKSLLGAQKVKKKRQYNKSASTPKSQSSNVCKNGVVRHRRTRCKKCEPCQRNDCEECNFCRDMKKFGGPGRMKQSCRMRQCVGVRYFCGVEHMRCEKLAVVCTQPTLAHSAVCNICKEDGWKRAGGEDGVTEEDGPSLMECSLCWEIVHPSCLQVQQPELPRDCPINDDLPSSWQCPKCYHGGAPEEVKPRTIKLKKFKADDGVEDKKRKLEEDTFSVTFKKERSQSMEEDDEEDHHQQDKHSSSSSPSLYKEDMAHLFVTSSEDEEEDSYLPDKRTKAKTLSEKEMMQLFEEDDEDSTGVEQFPERLEKSSEDIATRDALPLISDDFVEVAVDGGPADYLHSADMSQEEEPTHMEYESVPSMSTEEILDSSIPFQPQEDILANKTTSEPTYILVVPSEESKDLVSSSVKDDLGASSYMSEEESENDESQIMLPQVSPKHETTTLISYLSLAMPSKEVSSHPKEEIKPSRLEEDIFSKRKTVDIQDSLGESSFASSIQHEKPYHLFHASEPKIAMNQEIMLKVFAFLPSSDLYHCQLVCKAWAEWAVAPSLWLHMDVSGKAITPYLLMGIVKRQPLRLDLSHTDISGTHLSWLAARLPHLKELALRGCEAQAVASLWTAYCPCLQSLDLSQVSGLNDTLVERLLSPPTLHDRKVKNRLRLLQHLNLSGTEVSDLTLRVLAHRLQSLSSLTLSCCPHISDLGVAVLGAVRAPTLMHLDLSHCPAISDTSLDSLVRCPNLVSLNLQGCPLISRPNPQLPPHILLS
ncbi:KDM2A [Cordylochernes scorpioides]|uniref:KDM2A n=1 Tax=Cordylochernes scorpioides TaxID=51811 RepID=A0ABY6KDZ0_9ARAC|nr:KDM2A [Cordylochernes scorpioides]